MGRRLAVKSTPSATNTPVKASSNDDGDSSTAQAALEAAVERVKRQSSGSLDCEAVAGLEAALANFQQMQVQRRGAPSANQNDESAPSGQQSQSDANPFADDDDSNLEFSWEDLSDAYDVDLDAVGRSERGIAALLADAADLLHHARLGEGRSREQLKDKFSVSQSLNEVDDDASSILSPRLRIVGDCAMSVSSYVAGRPFATAAPECREGNTNSTYPKSARQLAGGFVPDDRSVPESIRYARKLAAKAPTVLSQVGER